MAGKDGSDSAPDGKEFEVKIQNIVAFTDLGAKLSLEKILSKVENTEYQPEQFPGLIYRMQNPRASALVFSQGKIVCTGTKSQEDLKKAMEGIVDMLKGAGFRIPKNYKTTVENIVASSRIEADLNLDQIAFELENSEYEPEQFPGLVYRIGQPRVAFLLFRSGRIIITGGRTLEEIHEALRVFKRNLEAIGIKIVPIGETDEKATGKDSGKGIGKVIKSPARIPARVQEKPLGHQHKGKANTTNTRKATRKVNSRKRPVSGKTHGSRGSRK